MVRTYALLAVKVGQGVPVPARQPTRSLVRTPTKLGRRPVITVGVDMLIILPSPQLRLTFRVSVVLLCALVDSLAETTPTPSLLP